MYHYCKHFYYAIYLMKFGCSFWPIEMPKRKCISQTGVHTDENSGTFWLEKSMANSADFPSIFLLNHLQWKFFKISCKLFVRNTPRFFLPVQNCNAEKVLGLHGKSGKMIPELSKINNLLKFSFSNTVTKAYF